MAERQIGTKPGTGGSAGGAYLRSRLELRFYPELWELAAPSESAPLAPPGFRCPPRALRRRVRVVSPPLCARVS